MRKTPLVQNEHYHIYNRGVDKRNIFSNTEDLLRFFQSMNEFNSKKPIGSIYEHSFKKKKDPQLGHRTSKLVNIVCYCLNPNHFHFILEQVSDNGISKFMQRLGNGYTKYFNEKYSRSGSLFQGKFKSKHVNKNEYLLHLSAYINLNYKVHKYDSNKRQLTFSSWDEYINKRKDNYCEKDIILGQFKNRDEYKKFAKDSLERIWGRKREDMEDLLLEEL